MSQIPDYYREGPEALVVALARGGDRDAFAELVRRRQSRVRNLMRHLCGDIDLADDLAQQVFLQAWRKVRHLRRPDRFGAWLKRLATNVWLQHMRKTRAWRDTQELDEAQLPTCDTTDVAVDLRSALATLAAPVRSCVVLSHHAGMTHEEIAEALDLPLGTVKSHIKRGSERLRGLLSAYADDAGPEEPR